MITSAPAPEVQYLPSIFRRIQTGDIKIPAFQRSFIWTEAQVLELLESIYRGFPIGSVLFWRVNEKVFKIARSDSTSFPETSEEYPLSYVLDGLQRLSTLYGCFHWKPNAGLDAFDVVFDLHNEEFLHPDGNLPLPDHHLHLSSIFSPKTFLQAQSKLMNSSQGDKLINRAITLHSTFQEYLIPTVTISDRTLEEVVAIFERINSTGTRLSTVDFLRAVTWAEEFDLNDELEGLSELAQAEGFSIPFETLAKIVAVTLNISPTAETMVQLRNNAPAQLHTAIKTSKDSLLRSLRYLKDKFHIGSYDYIPYEGQLLVLVKYTQTSGSTFGDHISQIMNWFWTTSFNEGLRGKPDHYVSRTIDAVDVLLTGQANPLKSRLTLAPEDLVDRKFIKGKALSSAIATLFAVHKAKSLFSGDTVTPDIFMSDFTSNTYEGLLSSEEIRATSGSTQSNRSIANIVLVTPTEKRQIKSTSAIALIQDLKRKLGSEVDTILLSQMIPPDAAHALLHQNYSEFLSRRAAFMYQKIHELTRG